jgi:hypothetical protein
MEMLRDTVQEQTQMSILVGSALFQDAMSTAYSKCTSTGAPGGLALFHRLNETVIHLINRSLAPQKDGGRGNHASSNFNVSKRDNRLGQESYLSNREVKTAASKQRSKELIDKMTFHLQRRGGNILASEP